MCLRNASAAIAVVGAVDCATPTQGRTYVADHDVLHTTDVLPQLSKLVGLRVVVVERLCTKKQRVTPAPALGKGTTTAQTLPPRGNSRSETAAQWQGNIPLPPAPFTVVGSTATQPRLPYHAALDLQLKLLVHGKCCRGASPVAVRLLKPALDVLQKLKGDSALLVLVREAQVRDPALNDVVV